MRHRHRHTSAATRLAESLPDPQTVLRNRRQAEHLPTGTSGTTATALRLFHARHEAHALRAAGEYGPTTYRTDHRGFQTADGGHRLSSFWTTHADAEQALRGLRR